MANQEVIELYCKNCGGSLLPISEDFCKCQNCGATYTQLTAKKQQELLDSFLNKQKQEQLNALRSHLWKEVNAKYIDSSKILAICLDIKNIYPDDFLANFYEVVCGDYEQGVIDFIDNIDCKENYELIEQVVKFLIKSLKSEYLLSVNNLIERAYKKNDLQKYNSLTTAFAEQAKKVEEGVYELNIPRDVFVAYSSADMCVVQKVVSELEGQGLTCFVAMRNLQHGAGAVDNYQKALETAIDNCRVFLLISSKNSRNFKCDVLKHELPYIKRSDLAKAPSKFANVDYKSIPTQYKKRRVEYRIDNEKCPGADSVVNEIFAGVEHCYSIEVLIERIANLIFNSAVVQDEESERFNQLEQQNKLLQERLEEQERRFKEQAEEQRRLKEQLNSQPTVNNVGGISIDEIIAKTEERKREKERAEAEERRLAEQKRLEEERRLAEQKRLLELLKLVEQKRLEEERRLAEQKRLEEERRIAEQKRLEEQRKKAEEIARDFQIQNGVLVKYNGSKKEVEIPDSVTSIGDRAFAHCSSLTSVTIPNSVTSIGDYAFYNCTSLTSVTIPDSVTSIGYEAFRACTSLTSVTIGNGVTFPLAYFLQRQSLTSVTIGDSVTSIGSYAFYGCSSLTSVTIGNSVTSIGRCAFSGCDSLTSVEIPDSVTSIGEGAFSGCDSLTSVTIGDSVTSICKGAFSRCDSLTSVTIPDSVTSIGDNAFYYCKSLTSVEIPDSVTSIGEGAFSGCYDLTSVTIGDSVTFIGDWAFNGCYKLTSVTIPDGVISIGKGAFWDCSNLTINVSNAKNINFGKDWAYRVKKVNGVGLFKKLFS